MMKHDDPERFLFRYMDEDGGEIESKEPLVLPHVWEICSSCRGEGKSSAHLGAFTQDEWAREDDEFKQDYMAGFYDRPCEHCDGGRAKRVDTGRFEREHPEEYAEWVKGQESDAWMDAMSESERRMGA